MQYCGGDYMSIISNLINSNANHKNLSSNSEASTTSTRAQIAASKSTTSSQSLDSYVRSEATSLADYLGKDSDNSSSGVYSVLTYGQQGQMDLICNKVQGGNNSTTNQKVTLADYLANDSTDELASLYSYLQPSKDSKE